MSDAIFQNQASGATFQNLLPDAIFCDHASDVYHEWHSVAVGCFHIRFLYTVICIRGKENGRGDFADICMPESSFHMFQHLTVVSNNIQNVGLCHKSKNGFAMKASANKNAILVFAF